MVEAHGASLSVGAAGGQTGGAGGTDKRSFYVTGDYHPENGTLLGFWLA